MPVHVSKTQPNYFWSKMKFLLMAMPKSGHHLRPQFLSPRKGLLQKEIPQGCQRLHRAHTRMREVSIEDSAGVILAMRPDQAYGKCHKLANLWASTGLPCLRSRFGIQLALNAVDSNHQTTGKLSKWRQ